MVSPPAVIRLTVDGVSMPLSALASTFNAEFGSRIDCGQVLHSSMSEAPALPLADVGGFKKIETLSAGDLPLLRTVAVTGNFSFGRSGPTETDSIPTHGRSKANGVSTERAIRSIASETVCIALGRASD